MSSFNKKFHKALNIKEPVYEEFIDIEELYNEYENCGNIYYNSQDSTVDNLYDKLYSEYANKNIVNDFFWKDVKEALLDAYKLGHSSGYSNGYSEGYSNGYNEGEDYSRYESCIWY